MIRQFIRRRNNVHKVTTRAVHPVHAMNAEHYQTSADPWTKPTDLSHWPTVGS